MSGQVTSYVKVIRWLLQMFTYWTVHLMLQTFTGKRSFNRRSLHAIGNIPNPYEQAISIIGRTLTPFDEDNLIPCFGFGDG